jgi:hypothetical protein
VGGGWFRVLGFGGWVGGRVGGRGWCGVCVLWGCGGGGSTLTSDLALARRSGHGAGGASTPLARLDAPRVAAGRSALGGRVHIPECHAVGFVSIRLE